MTYSRTAIARFTVGSWTEGVLSDIDGTGTTSGETYWPDRGISRADVSYTYRGDLEGTSTLVYLMGYRGGDDLVLGLERFEGSVAGQEGSCVLRHEARHGAGSVRGTLTVVPGMGTGALADLRGEADVTIDGHPEDGFPLTLHYDLG